MVVVLTLLGGFMVITNLCYWSYFLTQIKKYQSADHLNSTPSVSVIICAKDEEENIDNCLNDITAQNYPDYEIIVADDYSTDNTINIVERVKVSSSKSIKTFSPSKDILGKKLAIKEGVERASGEWIVMTDADCRVPDQKWLSHMMNHASIDTDVILGFGDYIHQNSWLNSVLRFETIYIALQYFSAALNGRAYMGVGRNIAFRKSAFLEKNPFHKHPIGPGDDDAIVSAIADRHNVAVSLHPESFTMSALPVSFSWKDYFQKKKRHISPFSEYDFTTKFNLALLGISHLGPYLVGSVLMFCGGWQMVIVALVIRWLIITLYLKLIKRTFPYNFNILTFPLVDVMLAIFYFVQCLFLPFEKKDW